MKHRKRDTGFCSFTIDMLVRRETEEVVELSGKYLVNYTFLEICKFAKSALFSFFNIIT